MIKYIGSKRAIIPRIAELVSYIPNVRRVCDLFAGTTRVGQAFKGQGKYVISNDLASYSLILGRTYIQADARRIDQKRILRLLGELEALPPKPGYFTRTFCEEARYFQPHNCARIDVIRDAIDQLACDDEERSILLTSLMLAADRVDSTTGLQMAYLKEWAPRAYKRLELRLPDLLPGSGLAVQSDANLLASSLEDVDLVYIDPPYNQHSYFSNYHIWETLVRNDKPEVYGIAKKRVDCRVHKSDYNSKRRIAQAFHHLIESMRAKYLLISFSTEGYLGIGHIEDILKTRGYVASTSVDFKRYVGAQIGIYNPQGSKVGAVSHLRNREHLFLVGPCRDIVESAVRTLERTPGNLQQAAMPL